jgi:hypothetical protein
MNLLQHIARLCGADVGFRINVEQESLVDKLVRSRRHGINETVWLP